MLKNNIIKIVTFFIFFLLLMMIPNSSTSKSDNIKKDCFQENIIIVDDEGDGDYISIQNAVDNASEGDTIYVYSGWYEETHIDKNVDLIGLDEELDSGDDHNYPTIDGNEYEDHCLYIQDVDNCQIRGFTMHKGDYGVWLGNVSFTTISDICFFVCAEGIRLDGLDADRSNNNIIENNSFLTCYSGITSEISSGNVIRYNEFTNNRYGVDLSGGHNNIICNNYFNLNGERSIDIYESAICIFGMENTTINNNLFEENYQGICVFSSSNTTIKNNNFKKNTGKNAYAVFTFSTVWEHNYWDRPRILPKPVPVVIKYIHIFVDIPICRFQFDMRPAFLPNEV